ncbi:hypothetical protein JCM31271_34640 [Halorubrum trueperi]
MKVPELGETLRQLAYRGADVMYDGSIAEHIADAVQRRGSLLTADDLRDFSPEFVSPDRRSTAT